MTTDTRADIDRVHEMKRLPARRGWLVFANDGSRYIVAREDSWWEAAGPFTATEVADYATGRDHELLSLHHLTMTDTRAHRDPARPPSRRADRMTTHRVRRDLAEAGAAARVVAGRRGPQPPRSTP
jgi:hypothetical protein